MVFNIISGAYAPWPLRGTARRLFSTFSDRSTRRCHHMAQGYVLTFMDAYPSCNKIEMHVLDQANTSFIIEQGLLLQGHLIRPQEYVGAANQIMVNEMFT